MISMDSSIQYSQNDVDKLIKGVQYLLIVGYF